jgi:hypothetical protein
MSVLDGDAPRGLIRQGDVLLLPVGGLPASSRLTTPGRVVLAEGEATGHAHVIDNRRARLSVGTRAAAGSLETRYLLVEGVGPVALTHEEHETLRVPPGVYEVRRQHEYTPRRRSRRVAD